MTKRQPVRRLLLVRLTVKRSDFERVLTADYDADVSYLEQDEFKERRAALHKGDFGFVGLRARVTVTIPLAEDHGVLHVVESPGLWGIEDDSGEDYFDQVFKAECDTLATMLTAHGVLVRAIFGARAKLSTASGRHFVTIGKAVYESPTLVGVIRAAILAEAKRAGVEPLDFLETAMARYLADWSRR